MHLIPFDYMEEEIFRVPYRRGKDKGFAEGLIEGIRHGKAELLTRQVARRFGPLPNWAVIRIREGASADIEAWSDRVSDAPSLDRMFAP